MQVTEPLLLSIVSPIYRGEKMLRELVDRITSSAPQITSNYKMILDNDAYPDNSWTEFAKACVVDRHAKVMNLSVYMHDGVFDSVGAGTVPSLLNTIFRVQLLDTLLLIYTI
jgi:hypothetical protein